MAPGGYTAGATFGIELVTDCLRGRGSRRQRYRESLRSWLARISYSRARCTGKIDGWQRRFESVRGRFRAPIKTGIFRNFSKC